MWTDITNIRDASLPAWVHARFTQNFAFFLQQEYIASLETADNGKTYANALGDVDFSVMCLRYFAGPLFLF